LKRLARRASARLANLIRAVIKGSSINNDAAAPSSVYASGQRKRGQARRDPAKRSRSPSSAAGELLRWSKAHGTREPARWAIPVEVSCFDEGLWRRPGQQPGWCALGSVKIECRASRCRSRRDRPDQDRASGSFTARSRRACISKSQNPRIDFARSPFFVNARLCAIGPAEFRFRGVPESILSRRSAGPTAFVALEEAPPPAGAGKARAPFETCFACRPNRNPR